MKHIKKIIQVEAMGGLILMFSALMALVAANSPLSQTYFLVLKTNIGSMSVLHWINDGLMAGFFLLVGLEIKREFQDGELGSWSQRALPAIAALGGMIVPALIYIYVNRTTPSTLNGWAIPCATDIAFVLGILSLLQKRVPLSLKIFLTALAIIDDLGAVVIIAIFYTVKFNVMSACGTGVITLILILMNRFGIKNLKLYLLLGLVLWVFMFKSGIHATVAGVVLAMTIPNKNKKHSPLIALEHGLQKWVTFLIVPLFSFANTGIEFQNIKLVHISEPVSMGIFLALFLGKQIGVFGACVFAIRMKLAKLPENTTWVQLYGASVLCGVGFTMSIFIGLLAFPYHDNVMNVVKIGVFTGSVVSGVFGALILIIAIRKTSFNLP
jgi:Na+:H+ antiporter, NhaA family